MVYTVNLLEVYPEDKLLRFLVKPIVEYPISASVLYLAVGIGLITRCVLTEGDAVCVYQLGGALIALLLWMIVVSVYSLHLHSKHQRMLESRATDNADK